MLNFIYKHLPPALRRLARLTYYSVIDFCQTTAKSRKSLTPPAKSALLVGGGDFKEIGEIIAADLKNRVDLNQNSRVLDIGCGYGRVALPLTAIIQPPGFYDGTDVVKEAIDWCTQSITSSYPHFNFYHSDVSNPYANAGKKRGEAANYVFPFKNSSYDIIILTSVFTHMRPNEIFQYLNEISRLLLPLGKCYATFYLLNSYSMDKIENKAAAQPFKYSFGKFMSTHKRIPEQTIAVYESDIRDFYNDAGLNIIAPISYGCWVKDSGEQYQDLIVAQKPQGV